MTRSTVLLSLAFALSLVVNAATANAQAKGDGIKVHGHWTVDVRNADGTLASHNEFENECVNCGQALSAMLTRQASVNFWQLRITGSQQPCDFGGSPTVCLLVEGPYIPPAGSEAFMFNTLQLTPANSSFDLAANFTATHAGQIDEVDSQLYTTTVGVTFSRRNLATPILVAAGQHVYVTVTFSFS